MNGLKFELVISPSEQDTTTRSRLDVAFLLDAVARRLRNNTEISSAEVRDATGELVGWWRLSDDDATPLAAG